MKNEIITNWEKVTQELADYFAKRYFGKDLEMWWVAEQIGDVLFINDYFFSVNDMLDFIRYNYSVKKMSEYYDYKSELGLKTDETPINIKNYLKLVKKQ